MPWRALLRVVDFERLVTAQADLADALEAAAAKHGPESVEARTLREGFNLLAKVLFTRRATISDVHDLAWLDHLVVARQARPSHLVEGEAYRSAIEGLASTRGRMAEMIPGSRMSSWADIPIHGFGDAESIKFERGSAGPYRGGLVTYEGALELLDEIAPLKSREAKGEEVLRELRRLAVAVRHEGRESVALVLAAAAL